MEIREQGLNQTVLNQAGLNPADLNSSGAGLDAGLDAGLKSTGTVSSTVRVYSSSESSTQNVESSALEPDWATLSDAGSTVSDVVGSSDERGDKVAAMRALLGAGTYQIPVQAVATSAVNAMLGLSA